MIKSRKFRRVFAVISAVALMICMAQTAVFADNTVDVYNGTYADGSVTVTGSINAKGAEMTMLAVRTDDENIELDSFATPEDLANAVMYIDQITATTDNFENTWTFALRDSVSGNFVVVFVSGTDANTAKIAIPLEEKSGVNGTAEIAGTEFVGSLPDPLVVLTGGDADWAGQVEIKVYDGDTEVAIADLTAPDELTTYTVTVNNTSDVYPKFEKTFTFTFISQAGADAAAAVAELNALPANLGVEVDKGDDAYTFTVPADTDKITYTATVDGEPVTDNPFTVTRDEENAKAVVVTATASGTDQTKTYSVTVPVKGDNAPVSVDAIVFANYEGEIYEDVYGIDGGRIVEIAANGINATAKVVKVGDVELFYSSARDKFVGVVVDYKTVEAVAAAISVEAGTSQNIYYGNVDDPFHEFWEEGDGVSLADTMRALQMKNGAAAEIYEYISADVDQDGEVVLSDVMLILQAKNGLISSFEIEAN